MPFSTRYVFIASMDIDPDKEDLFNEVYDEEHVPLLMKVPGVISITRLVKDELTMIIGGERTTIASDNEPKYSAVYEIESPDVLVSEGWANAVDAGRWPGEVRPYTSNRRHVLRKISKASQ